MPWVGGARRGADPVGPSLGSWGPAEGTQPHLLVAEGPSAAPKQMRPPRIFFLISNFPIKRFR